MAAVISLRKVLDALDEQNQSSNAYVNIKTGETFVIFEDLISTDLDADEDEVAQLKDWEKEELRIRREIDAGGDWKELPDSREIHEWNVLEAFADNQKDARVRDALFDAIRGRGAFQRFQNAVRRFEIEQEWYGFRAECFKDIATKWLDDQGLKFVDDTKPQG